MAVSNDSDKREKHILVCLFSSPSNERIVRTAAKMSHVFGGSFTALLSRLHVYEGGRRIPGPGLLFSIGFVSTNPRELRGSFSCPPLRTARSAPLEHRFALLSVCHAPATSGSNYKQNKRQPVMIRPDCLFIFRNWICMIMEFTYGLCTQRYISISCCRCSVRRQHQR